MSGFPSSTNRNQENFFEGSNSSPQTFIFGSQQHNQAMSSRAPPIHQGEAGQSFNIQVGNVVLDLGMEMPYFHQPQQVSSAHLAHNQHTPDSSPYREPGTQRRAPSPSFAPNVSRRPPAESPYYAPSPNSGIPPSALYVHDPGLQQPVPSPSFVHNVGLNQPVAYPSSVYNPLWQPHIPIPAVDPGSVPYFCYSRLPSPAVDPCYYVLNPGMPSPLHNVGMFPDPNTYFGPDSNMLQPGTLIYPSHLVNPDMSQPSCPYYSIRNTAPPVLSTAIVQPNVIAYPECLVFPCSYPPLSSGRQHPYSDLAPQHY